MEAHHQESSTHLVDQGYKSLQTSSSRVLVSSSVRFGNVSEISVSSCRKHQRDEDDVDVASLWYSEQDFARFKIMAMDDAKQVGRACPISRRQIRRVYEQTLTTSQSESSSDDDSTASTSCNLEELQSHDCVEAVGVEQIVDRGVYRHRKRRRLSLLETVCRIQKQASPETSSSCSPKDSCVLQHQPETALLLRYACEGITGPSKIFAQYLGSAASRIQDGIPSVQPFSCEHNSSKALKLTCVPA